MNRKILGVCALSATLGFAASLPPGQEAQWRAEIKKTIFVPEPLPALNAETFGKFEPAAGVTAERVTYGTEYGMRVPAILYLPKPLPKRKIPALIVVNGHGGDKHTWYAFYAGILYARAGAAVLAYDPIGEGERNSQRKSGTRMHDRVVQPENMGRRMAGLMVTDVSQAVSYLISRPEVDGRRIGAMGYSMGSWILSVACATETRLHACVLVGGGNLDGPGGYWDSSSKVMCQSIAYRSLMFLGDRPAALYALHASRGPTLIFNGLDDTVVAIPKPAEPFFKDMRQRTIELRGNPRGVFDYGFAPTGSHRPYFLSRPVALWLEDHLDFPNWSAGSIRKMPESHISEWAAAQGVAMDKLYATEEREGGLRALGQGIPAVSRKDLTVLTDQEWEKQKERLVYETWIKKALAEEGIPPK